MKNVKSGPIPLACTTIAGSRPILAASCSAAPSARARSRLVAERHRQRERQLHPPVAGGVAVGPHEAHGPGRAHRSVSICWASSMSDAGLK